MLGGVYIKDFMCYGETEFEPEADLLLVCGANGAGKSALFEATFWCLTGSTVRGVPAMNVIRHGCKSTEVTTLWVRGDVSVHVTRYKSKSENRVTIDIDDETKEFHNAADAQVAIDELFGNARLLSLVSFFGRKFTTFSRMSPRDRAEMIDWLAKADTWEQARSLAASDVSVCRRDVKDAEQVADEAETTLKSEREKLAEAEAALKTARREQQDALTKLRKQEREYKKELGGVEADLQKIEKEIAAIDKRLDAVDKKIKAHEDNARALSSSIAKIDGTISGLELPDEDECPTCRQTISAKLRRSIEATIKGLEKEHDKLAADHDEVLAKIRPIEESAAADRDRRRSAERDERLLRNDENESRGALAGVQRRIERAKGDDELHRLEERVRQLTDESIPRWKEKAKKARAEFKGSTEQLELAEFWAVGFKQIRALAMARVAGLLSTLMSQQAQALGLGVDRLDCSVWKEGSKKGSTRPELNLIVTRGEWQDPIEALSEGQTQRVDLACFLALGQLVKAIEGYDPGFRVLDEPLAGMDEDGKFRTFQLLSDQIPGQRFVIDHDANFQDLFREAIEVVLDEDGVASIEAL